MRKKEFHVFHCDTKWNQLASGGILKSLTSVKNEAGSMFPGVTATWIKTDVTKREAKRIEREMWRGYECSFCGKIPMEFEMSIHGKKAVICNICVNETYHDFLELQQ